MADVHLEFIDAVHIRIRTEAGILMELSDHFTFFKEGYKWSPRFKNRQWDGKIRLVNRLTAVCRAGLAVRIKKFCDSRGYTIDWDNELNYDNVSENEVREHLKSLNLPDWIDTRDFQVEAITKCLRSKRRTLLSPTSSGKSLMIYGITTWYKKKTLIIVPIITLVTQMKTDFESYGFTGVIDTSMGGLLKDNDIPADVVVTTWQALENGKSRMPEKWFEQFDVVFGDEAHGAKAMSMIKIMEAMKYTRYRFGTTGTLSNDKLEQHTIEGLFGPQLTTITTREMIDQGYASDIKIKCIVLRYSEAERKEFNKSVKDTKTGKSRKKSYKEEVDYIVDHEKRSGFIKNLVLSLEGNKLLFFRIIKHGEKIYASLADTENAFYIDGSIKGERREEIRQAIEQEENCILVASLGTTSTGVSINKLHHMIAASPSKSKIKVLQSIGRMLRQHKEKSHAVLYDIVDDFSYGSNKNYTLTHFEERVKIYDAEEFDYKIYVVGIK